VLEASVRAEVPSATEAVYEYQIPASAFARPPAWSLLSSICIHVLAVFGLLSIHFEPALPKPYVEKSANHPTVLKIGDKIYFVAELPPTPKADPDKPAPPKVAKKVEPVKTRVKSAAIEAPTLDRPAQAPKVLARPEVHKNPFSDATLIQPSSPADKAPEITPLPTFRALTGQPSKAKPLVTPGRPKPPTPEEAQAAPQAPEIPLVHADPVTDNHQSAAVLPPTPVLDAKLSATSAPPPLPVGDAVNILSLNDKPAPPSDKLVVPAGNMVGRTGEGTVLIADASLAAGTNVARAPLKPPAAPTSKGAVTPVAAQVTASSPPIATIASLASINAASSAARPGDPPGVIRHPANGNFDAVVVLSNPGDQSPEAKQLLTGTPIYAVYVTLGTPKEWALYFCIPGEKDPTAQDGHVVKLGSQGAPVQAPYPTLMVRPDVKVPAFYRTVLVYGRVNAAGRFENLRVVKSIKPETDEALVSSLSRWEFRPATRDGVNIGVEFLLSIPVAGL
jgi:hypothetical protein